LVRPYLLSGVAAVFLCFALMPPSIAFAQVADDRSSAEPDRPAQAAGSNGITAPQAAPIPFKKDDQGGIGTGAAAGTAACLLLLGVWGTIQIRSKGGRGPGPGQWPALLMLRGRGAAQRERSLRVLETAALSAQVRLHVVRWRGKDLLIASWASGAQILDPDTAPPVPDPAGVPVRESE
jgi:hypothetical protein